MEKRIIDLVSDREFDELKGILEAKLAKKIKEKIDTKKSNFIEKIRSEKCVNEAAAAFTEKDLYSKLKSEGIELNGGLLNLAQNKKILVSIDRSDVEVQCLTQKTIKGFEQFPVSKGLDAAVSFVKEFVAAMSKKG